MKKFLSIFTFCVSVFAFSGCSWFQSDGAGAIPYNLTTADQAHYNTIGIDFQEYYTEDEALDPDILSIYENALIEWSEEGSDWDTFETIAGFNMNGPYVVYFESDSDLTEVDRASKYLNVESWRLNVEKRNGAIPQPPVVSPTD